MDFCLLCKVVFCSVLSRDVVWFFFPFYEWWLKSTIIEIIENRTTVTVITSYERASTKCSYNEFIRSLCTYFLKEYISEVTESLQSVALLPNYIYSREENSTIALDSVFLSF